MATLTNEQMKAMWQKVYRKEERKAELKADGLQPRATVRAIFQAAEDWYEGEQATVKGLLVTAKGSSMTNDAAKAYMRGFFLEKIKEL